MSDGIHCKDCEQYEKTLQKQDDQIIELEAEIVNLGDTIKEILSHLNEADGETQNALYSINEAMRQC